MHTVIWICLAGGLLSIFTFIHFFVDWIFQSHAEAMVKHNNPKIRAKHCAIYTLGFLPLLGLFFYLNFLTLGELIASILILFISHFCEDTYIPVFYWARYIRRPPTVRWQIKLVDNKGVLFGPDGEEYRGPANQSTDPNGNQWRLDLANSVQIGKDYFTTQVNLDKVNEKLHMRGFGEFVETPIGKILMIAIDQIIHITFLLPVVYFVLHHLPFFIR